MRDMEQRTDHTKPDLPVSSGAYRLVVAVGAAVGLSIMGDSLLYNILPLAAERLGIPTVLVGFLLSANRLVRLASNTWVSRLFERLGPRLPFLVATLLAVVTTTIYGFGWGFLVFLIARIGWGIAWSSLRQGGFQAVWTGGEADRGRLMGVLWGTIRLGSAGSVLLGGYLYDRYGYRAALGSVAGLTALAVPVAFMIRWPPIAPPSAAARQRPQPLRIWRTALTVPIQRWLLASGFLHSALEGIFVSTLSLFVADRLGAQQALSTLVATLTGALLAVRWLSGLVFGPALGALSDRFGQPRMAALLAGVLLVSVVGMVGLPGPWPVLCVSVVFVAGAGLFVTLSAIANGVAVSSDRPHRFVGVYTTAADAGLAAGPLLAYSVGGAMGLAPLYSVGACLLILVVLRLWWLAR